MLSSFLGFPPACKEWRCPSGLSSCCRWSNDALHLAAVFCNQLTAPFGPGPSALRLCGLLALYPALYPAPRSLDAVAHSSRGILSAQGYLGLCSILYFCLSSWRMSDAISKSLFAGYLCQRIAGTRAAVNITFRIGTERKMGDCSNVTVFESLRIEWSRRASSISLLTQNWLILAR